MYELHRELNGEYPVEIDFEGASIAWNRNKKVSDSPRKRLDYKSDQELLQIDPDQKVMNIIIRT